jgi:predicted helicase
MYTRFIRWASDRIGDQGVIALIVGRKPISKGAYNGFRKVIADEFCEIYIVDLGGDVIENPKLSGTKHNVFGIKIGVAIILLVRRSGAQGCKIRYVRRPELEVAEDKLAFLAMNPIRQIDFDLITPDKRNDWLNQATVNWDHYLPLVDINNRNKKTNRTSSSIFQLISSGLQTKQDDWTFDVSEVQLRRKIAWLIDAYNTAVDKGKSKSPSIKWHRELDKRLKAKKSCLSPLATCENHCTARSFFDSCTLTAT